MSERKIKIGITQGDTNGIGYEVIMKALNCDEMLQLCTPIIYGSPKVLSYHRKAIDMQQFGASMTRNADNARDGVVNLIDVMNGEEVKIELGEPSKAAGHAAFAALEAAVTDLKAGRIDALVTAPINKDNIQSDKFNFTGHTEYLQARCQGDGNALMILFDEHVRVALVTTHLPISQVSQAITLDTILTRLRTFDASLRRDFGIERPRIAVLALNPHAGENGLLGNEEKDIIVPAIGQAYDESIMCFGPYSADSFFALEQYRHFDGVLAMYHDQGLAPFKTIARGTGVNFTAGLPIVRTSPDHGTGYDITGTNTADATSMRHAIYAAIDICRNRAAYDEATANPLGKLYEARGKDNVVLDLTKDENDE
ncbi:MAG: 4-hydroxythreonine-4-phosphate dehydrogenase PdxA [Muribaculaceae bacterium]|nr:4-hydroxythreonine-4-phosphate dehydrogenase PdxA [Muribaculaceae bacterium]